MRVAASATVDDENGAPVVEFVFTEADGEDREALTHYVVAPRDARLLARLLLQCADEAEEAAGA